MGDAAVEGLLAGVVRGAGVGDLTLDVRIEGEKEFLRHSLTVRLGELFDEAGLDVLDLHVGRKEDSILHFVGDVKPVKKA